MKKKLLNLMKSFKTKNEIIELRDEINRLKEFTGLDQFN